MALIFSKQQRLPSDSFCVQNGSPIAKNRKLKHAGLFLFKVIQIYADPLIQVHRGRTRIRICSLHSKESNVYVWRPAGMSDLLSGECMCLMLESPWDMGTFCKSVLSQLVSEHNFPALSRNGVAAGKKKKRV